MVQPWPYQLYRLLWACSVPHVFTFCGRPLVLSSRVQHLIWSLPRRSHTALVHLTASLSSVYNMIYLWSASLFHRALTSKSSIRLDGFLEVSVNICTFIGYNLGYGCRHIKVYREDECLFANILRDVLLLPSSNGHIRSELLELSCAS